MEEQRKGSGCDHCGLLAWQRRPLVGILIGHGVGGAERGLRHRALVHVRERGGFNRRRFLVIALACRGAVKPGSFAMWPGVAALRGGFAASAVFAQAGVALEMAPLRAFSTALGKRWFDCLLDIFSMQESERLIYAWCALGFAGFHCRWLSVSGAALRSIWCVRHGGLLACLLSRVGCIGA